MAALDQAHIPSGINTFERLLVWAAQCGQSISNGQEVNVQENAGSVPTVQVQLGTTADGVYRWIITGYIPCDAAALNSGTQKTWMAAEDIGNAQPHQNLMAN
jgi:hypothetical protein